MKRTRVFSRPFFISQFMSRFSKFLCDILYAKGGIALYEWNEIVQIMIEWIEKNLTENPSLLKMSEQIGYSPCYCSSQFHKICGISLKSYIAGRKLAKATIDIRDTDHRILDIALACGYSSQDALTRAFTTAFGCTPAQYRKHPTPIPISLKKTIYLPQHYHEIHKGEETMKTEILKKASIRIEFIPSHKYIGIWDNAALNYGDFWKKHNCDEICGLIESMRNFSHPVVGCHTAGWKKYADKLLYFYGMGIADDYTGPIPDGFEIQKIPASYYMVFYHPPFDYLKSNHSVMQQVEKAAWNYDIEKFGLTDEILGYYDNRRLYEWNEQNCPCYQRHYPEVLGYEILRPIKLKL